MTISAIVRSYPLTPFSERLLATRLREAVSDEDRARYRQHIEQILEEADGLDGEMLEAVRDVVERAQDSLTARWVRVVDTGTEWDAFITPKMVAAVNDVAGRLNREYNARLTTILPKSYEVGTRLVDTGIGAAGVKISALPQIAPETLKVAARLKPELVTKVGDEMKVRIQKEIQRGFVVGDSPYTVMQNLAKSGLDAGPWKSVAYRGEIIARTEMATVQGVATQARMVQAVEAHPEIGMRKKWVVAAARNNAPCPRCREYGGKVYDVKDPAAPQQPLHPCCLCCWIPVFPDNNPTIIVPTESLPDLGGGGESKS